MMNYADIKLGTWYPMGGMSEVVKGMVEVCEELGVRFQLGNSVQRIDVKGKKADGLMVNGQVFTFDAVISSGDYHHTETKLLPTAYQSYNKEYWESRTMAPSCLLYYLGVNKKVEGLLHHNLFFDSDFGKHAREIYESPAWPSDPLFYACVPSKTDPTVAPEGKENIFLLIPVAPGMPDTPEIREKYLDILLDRLEARTGESIRSHIEVKRTFAYQDFISQYNSFKGNAYGLANTLGQTAFLKPKMRSKKVENLFYSGQLTVPGPGVPPSLISGEVAAHEIEKYFAL
jgi:phytoene desaturase